MKLRSYPSPTETGSETPAKRAAARRGASYQRRGASARRIGGRVHRRLQIEELEPRAVPGIAIPAVQLGHEADYVILTTGEIAANSKELWNFVSHKESLGLHTAVVTEAQWGGGTGAAAAERIRSWLAGHYGSLGIDYALLIGNPDPYAGDVPMKITYPMFSTRPDEITPTDYYYADLTSNWNADGDRYFGEWKQDLSSLPAPEIFVGRIPFYGSYDELDRILRKTMDYELSADIAWRKSALLPIGMSNYEGENHAGIPRVDGHELGQYMVSDVLAPAGWSHYTLLEKAGLKPVTAPADAPLTEEDLIAEWQKGYGVMAWWGHGSRQFLWRRYWEWDDGDRVAEDAEMKWAPALFQANARALDDTRPSVALLNACNTGSPQHADNLGYSLLKNGAIATIPTTSTTWYGYISWNPAKARDAGDSGAINYDFLKYVINGATFSEALYRSIGALGSGLGSMSWMNVLSFNLYGDPSLDLGLDGIAPTAALNALDLINPQGGEYVFTVTYADNKAVAAWSLNGSEIRVVGPNGLAQAAQIVTVSGLSNAPQIAASYRLSAAGGAWSEAEMGVYTVWLEGGVVSDIRGNVAAGMRLGTFSINEGAPVVVQAGKPHRFLDGDGSTVAVLIRGPGVGYLYLTNGLATGAAIESFVVEGATERTAVKMQSKGGAVPGTSVERIEVNPASGTAALRTLSARTMALTPGGLINAAGDIGALTLGSAGEGSQILIQGSATTITLGNLGDSFGLNVQGGIGKLSTANIGAGADIAAGGGIGTITVSGSIAAGSSGQRPASFQAGAEGIRKMTIKGDADFALRTAGGLDALAIVGSASAPRKLSGLMDVMRIGSLKGAWARAEGLTIRAQEAIGMVRLKDIADTVISTGALGSLAVTGDLTGSRLLAGHDIGADLQLGSDDDGGFVGRSGSIGTISVGGNLTATSIAAGVSPGADGFFGSEDDVVVSGTLEGAIRSLTVKGAVSGSTNSAEQYGVVARGAMGRLVLGGRPVLLSAEGFVLGNLLVAGNRG